MSVGDFDHFSGNLFPIFYTLEALQRNIARLCIGLAVDRIFFSITLAWGMYIYKHSPYKCVCADLARTYSRSGILVGSLFLRVTNRCVLLNGV